MSCFYCDPENESRKNLMFTVGSMKYGTLYLMKDQAHKGRCVVGLNDHVAELSDLTPEACAGYMAEVAAAAGAVKKLWGCTKINLAAFGDKLPHLHFHIVPKYEGGFEFGGGFEITNPNPVFLSDAEYQEMMDALKKELNIQ